MKTRNYRSFYQSIYIQIINIGISGGTSISTRCIFFTNQINRIMKSFCISTFI